MENKEKIIVKCEHCGGELDLGKQDICPTCDKSCFLDPVKDIITGEGEQKLMIYVSAGKNMAGVETINKSTWVLDKFNWIGDKELHVYIKENSDVKVERILKSDLGQLKLEL